MQLRPTLRRSLVGCSTPRWKQRKYAHATTYIIYNIRYKPSLTEKGDDKSCLLRASESIHELPVAKLVRLRHITLSDFALTSLKDPPHFPNCNRASNAKRLKMLLGQYLTLLEQNESYGTSLTERELTKTSTIWN